MRGEIAATIVLQTLAQFAARFPKDARADSIAIARRAFQPESQPIVSLGGVVFQEHRSAAVSCNEHIKGSVIVIVPHGQTSRSEALLKRRPPFCAYIFQLAVRALMKEQERLLVPNLARVTPDHVVWMAVGQDQIDRAVVVIVEILESPATQKPGRLRNAVRVCDIVEGLVFIVVVKRKHFLIDVSHKEILPSVVVQIAGVDAQDRKSTRLNSSHVSISYAVFCLKKKITRHIKSCRT